MSEPHRIVESMSRAEACRVLGLLERTGVPEVQATLNGLAVKYRVATAMADAATVNRRLHELAEGVRQAALRYGPAWDRGCLQ